jgi:hypothetical protein
MAKARSKRQQHIATIRKRIRPFSESSQYVKCLFYGRNGRGKTRAAAQSPNPVLIDCNEEGTESVRNFEGDVIPVTTWEEFVWAYWLLKEGDHGYQTVIVDTLTMLQNIATKYVLDDSYDRDPTRDPKQLSQPQWGKLAEVINPVLLNYRNLPMHVVFVCQERTFDNDEEERVERVPDLSPKIRMNAMSCVSVIGHMEMRKFRRGGKKKKEVIEYHSVMLTGPDEVYTACKSRIFDSNDQPVLPRYMVDPSVNKILNYREKAK